MYYETEKTLLLCVKTDKDYLKTLKLCDFSIVFSNNMAILCLDDNLDIELKGDNTEVKYFSLDVTNDPKTHHKFNITNLGYYSIRLTSQDGTIYKHNNKYYFVFKIEHFNIHFNSSVYITEVNNKDFYEQLSYSGGKMILDFNFKECNYIFDLSIYKDDNYKKIYFNLLSLDDNYRILAQGKKNIKDKINKLLN